MFGRFEGFEEPGSAAAATPAETCACCTLVICRLWDATGRSYAAAVPRAAAVCGFGSGGEVLFSWGRSEACKRASTISFCFCA